MAKAPSDESEFDTIGLSGIVDEATRLAAIAKVQQAFDSLGHDNSSTEVSLKRIRLLELWRTLVNMRQFDAPILSLPSQEERGSDDEIAPAIISAEKGTIEIETTPEPLSVIVEDDSVAIASTQQADNAPEHAGPAPANILHEAPRIRLRLIRPGILHDMVLPTGTVVLVHSSDAHDILERGIAEILLGPEPDQAQAPQ